MFLYSVIHIYVTSIVCYMFLVVSQLVYVFLFCLRLSLRNIVTNGNTTISHIITSLFDIFYRSMNPLESIAGLMF